MSFFKRVRNDKDNLLKEFNDLTSQLAEAITKEDKMRVLGKETVYDHYIKHANECSERLLNANIELQEQEKIQLEKLKDTWDTSFRFYYLNEFLGDVLSLQRTINRDDPHLKEINECLKAALNAFQMPYELINKDGALTKDPEKNQKAMKAFEQFLSASSNLCKIEKVSNPFIRSFSLKALQASSFLTATFIGAQIGAQIGATLAVSLGAIAIGTLTCGAGIGVIAACLAIYAGTQYLLSRQKIAEIKSKQVNNLAKSCENVVNVLRVNENLKGGKENKATIRLGR